MTGLSHQDRARLLDRFPLTDAELGELLPLASAYEADRPFASLAAALALRTAAGNKKVALRLVKERIGRLLEATRENVFLLAFADGDALSDTAKFLEACMVLLGRRGEVSLGRALWEGARTSDREEPPTAESLVTWILDLLVAVDELSSSSFPVAREDSGTISRVLPASWVSSLTGQAGHEVSSPFFRQWISDTAPSLPFALSTFCHLLFWGSSERLGRPWSLLQSPSSVSSIPMDYPLLTGMATAVPLVAMGLHGFVYKSLYQSTERGLSFPTLQSHLTSYWGPTLLLLRTATDLIGYYTEIPWKISSSGAGIKPEDLEGKEAFVFSLHPVWCRYGRTYEETSSRAVQTLHGSHSRSGQTGLSVGGISADTPRLHLTTSLEGCKAVSIDRSFQSGSLLGPLSSERGEERFFFDVEEIQLYAVASDVQTLENGQDMGQRAVDNREALRQKVAQVDRAQFVDDLVFMPGSHLYEHRQQTRGRADFVADNDEGRGYYISQKPPSPRRGNPKS
jgi:hypothetical protein